MRDNTMFLKYKKGEIRWKEYEKYLINRRNHPISFDDYFWNNVDKKGEDECWNWKGCTDSSGYGNFFFSKKQYGAHRIAYMLKNGNIDERLCVLHICDNPSCVNPNHLFLGTKQDNSDDMIEKGRDRKTCHLGELNPNSKLTLEQVVKIREMYNTGNYYQWQIADKFGVCFQTISLIVNNKLWK